MTSKPAFLLVVLEHTKGCFSLAVRWLARKNTNGFLPNLKPGFSCSIGTGPQRVRPLALLFFLRTLERRIFSRRADFALVPTIFSWVSEEVIESAGEPKCYLTL